MLTKDALRSQLSASRSQRSDAARELARAEINHQVQALCRSMALPAGSRIAAYQPLRTEPGSLELLVALTTSGYEVIVPITLADNDLDWQRWQGSAAGAGGSASGSLGVEAISDARLVLVPAFAVDPAGHRLGRGGGSYDRALARVRASAQVAALLFEDEFVANVPVESWDRPVSAVVLPSGWRVIGT